MREPSNYLLSHGWTCEITPEAVIYTKPGRKPIVYDRREMVERVNEKWSDEAAVLHHSKAMKAHATAYWAQDGVRQRMSEALKAYWAQDGVRQRMSEALKAGWAARRQATAKTSG
jgi:hypothetical protein